MPRQSIMRQKNQPNKNQNKTINKQKVSQKTFEFIWCFCVEYLFLGTGTGLKNGLCTSETPLEKTKNGF